MLFAPRRNNLSVKKIRIDNLLILRVSSCKFLRLIIDDKLTWCEHIKHVTSNISKSIGIINKVKYGLLSEYLPILYNNLILPYLTYTNQIWGSIYHPRLQS